MRQLAMPVAGPVGLSGLGRSPSAGPGLRTRCIVLLAASTAGPGTICRVHAAVPLKTFRRPSKPQVLDQAGFHVHCVPCCQFN